MWSLTSDTIKVVAATWALQLSEKPAHAFVFNLTPEAIEAAMANPEGFLDSLKRSFDVKLKRALGVPVDYLFVIDVDKKGRLNIQGAFGADAETLPVIRQVMKNAWGEWQGKGKHKQVWFSPTPCDDGWASYCMRNRAKVAKIIKGRTYTITTPLRRDAEDAYMTLRRIMRGGVGYED